jgi:two-component system LytT family response regulator
MPTYTALIIDDEAPACIRLRRLLAEHAETIKILDEAADGNEALQKIEALKPDVIFLDIQMSGMDGFEVLQKISHTPIVIFTTAYDQYALKAYETNSVDYLLKPIEPERLRLAICKLERLSNGTSKEQIQKIIDFANQLKPRKEISSFPVKTGDTIHLVRTTEIAYLEAKDKYVTIHTLDGKEFLTDVSLKVMEEKLPGNFLRIHRAFIVNKSMVYEIRKYFQGRFIFLLNDKDRTKITSGSGYSDVIKNELEQL